MDKAKLKKFREQLEEIIARIQPDATAATEQTRDPVGLGELSNVPMHLGDRGTEEYLQDLNATLAENQRNLLDEATDAMHRINDGTFGICENCGKPILEERLEAIPYARYCTACAAANPARAVNLNEGRPRRADETLSGREQGKQGRSSDEGSLLSQPEPETDESCAEDVYAAGTPGGGTAFGGLAGSNVGHGEPKLPELEKAAGSSEADSEEAKGRSAEEPQSGRSGGAVGGTPARKRSVGEG
jgi:RNA polymerase-binding transcription factor DksA